MATVFHHIHVKTADWRAVVDWYTRCLGAKLVFELGHGNQPSFGARLELNGTHVHVTGLRSDGMGEKSPFPESYGFEHLAFFVDEDELAERLATMTAEGAKILEDAVFQGGRVVYVEIPGPIMIELMVRRPKR
ncbi:MAG: VOC family protein [Deltaproteobacteria bacterium]|nr:VOC family protein [Deltaproteobacteria bacterium]